MSIRGKFFIIIFAVILSFLISIGVYFFLQKFIRQLENEKSIINELRIACIRNQLEINRLQNAYFMNQIIIYKESKVSTKEAFKRLENITILPKINKSIEIAIEKIFNLQDVVNKLNDNFALSLDLIVDDARSVFQKISQFKVGDFFQDERALIYPDIKLIQNNVSDLMNDIGVINENLNSSVSIINSQFEIINEEIERLKLKSNFISTIIVLLLLVICVLFSFFISNKIIFSIKEIEKAIEKVAKGDFTTKLDIKTNDEFRLLSDNYNFLIKDLKGKIESELDFMKNVSSAITDNIDFDKILDLITEFSLKDTNAEGAAVFLFEEEYFKIGSINGAFSPILGISDIDKINSNYRERKYRFNETLLGEIIKVNQPTFIKNNILERKIEFNNDVDLTSITSLITFPLIMSKKNIGILAIVTVKKENLLTDLDYTHLSIFAEYASLTLQNWKSYLELIEKKEIERDIKIAAEIQKKLLPDKIIKMDKLDISVYSMPAKGVGGDYYDIIQLSDDRVALVVCDVSGKGISAALLMVMIRTILHLILSSKGEIGSILNWINRGIIGSIGIEYFATFGMVIYNYKTKEIIYSNAAQAPLLVYKKSLNKVFQVDTVGIPLGIEKESKYGQKRFKLDNGDFIVFYTDGIVEAIDQNKNQYKLGRLINMLKKYSDQTSEEIINQIIDDIKNHSKKCKQFDDQTLLMLKVV